VVTRGHGGREAGPLQVDERRHSAADVGDEALLLSAHAPTGVARARAAGAQAAVAAGAGVIVLDDGFQNPGLEKDLSIVVIDTGVGFGNGRIIPAGPLREPVAAGLARADLVLGIGAEAVPADARAAGRPVLRGQLTPLQTGMDWRGLRVLAFAGIGRPGKFFATLRSLGAEVVQTVPLADHAALPPRLMARLIAEAKLRNAQLVTTEKDAVRLSAGDKRAVLTLPVRLEIRDADALMAKLDRLGL
jgi:tetraacyldisaccharide 4'-kinase